MAGLHGPVAITHQEIHAWQQLTGIPLRPWEARTLRKLSRDWVVELERARDPQALPPAGVVERKADPVRVGQQLDQAFRSMGFRMEREPAKPVSTTPAERSAKRRGRRQ